MFRHFVLLILFSSFSGCSFKPSALHFDDMKLRPEKVTIESRIQLGDLYYVESVMNEVFEYGVKIPEYSSSIYDQQYQNEVSQLSKILKKQTFGAGSDPYYRVTSSISFERRGCEASYTPLVIEADSSPTRAVEIAKACDDSINDPFLFAKVIRKIVPDASPKWNPYSNNANTSDFAVTPERIISAYQLFYPLEIPSPETIEALKHVGLKSEVWLTEKGMNKTEANKIKQSWSLILAAICYSPDWQSP